MDVRYRASDVTGMSSVIRHSRNAVVRFRDASRAGFGHAIAAIAIAALPLIASHAHAFATAGYFPLIDLASWTVNLNGAAPHTAHVWAGTFPVNTIPTKLIEYGDGRFEYLTNDASGIRSHKVFTPGVDVPGFGPHDQTITFDPPVPWATADSTLSVAVAGSGSANMVFTGLGSAPLSYTSSSTPVAFESVTVPAGTFNALKFVQTLRISGTFGGSPVDVTANATYWFINGLGPVKQEVESHDTGSPPGTVDVRELVASSLLPRRADFDGIDSGGKSDILWRNVSTGLNSVWFMNGAARTGYATTLTVTPGADWEIAGTGDFDRDGKADLLWRNTNPASPSFGRNTVWLMNGATRTAYGEIPRIADANWKVAGVADFDGDGKSDILWRNEATGQNSIWIMNGASRASYALAPAVSGSVWKVGGIGDFDGDGKADILWRETAGAGRVSVWLMNGATRLSYGLLPAVADQNWKVAGVADFDGGGKADIVWRNETTGQNSIWIMNGASRASYALAPSVAGADWKIAALGDYDGNGKADLLWRNTNAASPSFGRNIVWMMNGATRTSSAEIPRIADANWKVVGP